MSVLPNLFLIGAAKSGTSALYAILNEHPQVFFPLYKKELRFFSDDENYNKGLDWLSETFFKDSGQFPVRGDASPQYLYWSEKVAPRIYEDCGQARPKILVILREPAARAYSHYWMGVRLHDEELTFQQALDREEERLRDHLDELRLTGRMIWGYFRGGCYATLLKPYFELFPPEDILVLLNEELQANFSAVIAKLVSFLNLDPAINLELKYVNEAGVSRSEEFQQWLSEDSPGKTIVRQLLPFGVRFRVRKFLWRLNRRRASYEPMPKEIKEMLRRKYLPEVQELERMTGLSLKNWYPR